jgi:spore germination protein YaaH
MTDPSPRTLPQEGGDVRDLLTDVFAARETPPSRPIQQPDAVADADAVAIRKRLPGRNVAMLGSAFVFLCVGLVAGGVIGSTSATTPPPHATTGGPQATRLAVNPTHLHLSPATSAVEPAPPAVALTTTSPHEVFAYAPYWSLSDSSSFPVDDFSTIAYFSVDVNPNGSIEQSGPGWTGYESQSFVNLVNRAHQAGVRVVLTATDFSQASLDTLTHDPGAADVLGENLVALVETKRLDGVNLDFEGVGSADQAGLDRLVSRVAFIMRLTDPHYQITMATYASSASDPRGFYDISGLAPSVDAFFVMAYDVSQGATGQAGGKGQDIDESYVASYTAAAPASKVILGVPLFGYDMQTSGPELGASQTGTSQPVTYAQAMSSGPTYWDPMSDTAWTEYQSSGQWHQVFFDNANSLALKEQLVSRSNLLGIGVWALGMQGSDNAVLSILAGGSPPSRLPPVGPPQSSTSALPSPTPLQQVKVSGTGENGGAPTTIVVPPRRHRHTGGRTASTTNVSESSTSTPTTVRPISTTTTSTTPPSTTTTSKPAGESPTTTTTITSGS